jgi:putative hemolysin
VQVATAIGQSRGFPHLPNFLSNLLIEDSKYLVRFTQTTEEIESALKLRFEVFNLELGEGLESSFKTGRDRDEFDATCEHLIVIERDSGKVIGTYRVRTMEMARGIDGFYSAGEFDLRPLPLELLQQSVELGRACIAREHRDRRVLFLLWKALAHYALKRRKPYLFGCCSLTSQDPREGNKLLDQLSTNGYLHPTVWIRPKPGYECQSKESWPFYVKLPRLFKTYLGIGAKVCGPPAIDRSFKTIDFFVLFDIREMSLRTRRMFFSNL